MLKGKILETNTLKFHLCWNKEKTFLIYHQITIEYPTIAMSSVEELTKQVEELSLIVKKQQTLLQKTGQQVLSLQVDAQKKRVEDFEPTSLSGKGKTTKRVSALESTDFATNEDLVQLVGELQGQLEILEERSIRRLINSQKKDTENLALVLNHDGEQPPLELFPSNIEEFTKIKDEELVQLARFYELLPPTAEERAQFEDFVEGKTESPENPDLKITAASYTKEDLVEAFDSIARFIGVKVRRGVDAW